ncbi:hypothetical protein GDO81_016995 [Engystomops pustulosus]|uniref:Uncharacterized protein n=1 Tax=Engystomops pustulosus TaxID=76066 RepID=A0AAV7AC93_ENGPU|nr:hypothetical protein GDO81_016995 [Engystomops pustulosus]
MITAATAESAKMADKIEDLENRSRRSNIRMVGLPESITLPHLHRIFSETLPQLLGMQSPVKVERAHRIGPLRESRSPSSQQTGGEERSRQAIAKYLN